MKVFIILLFSLIPFFGLTQYPKIEMGSDGQKVVIFTLEQAQKIDNDLEILKLLEIYKLNCDSLNLTNIALIDEQKNKIVKLERIKSELDLQISDKNLQLKNSDEKVDNLDKSIITYKKEIENKDTEIKLLRGDIKKVRIKSLGIGFIIGGVTSFILLSVL